MLILILDGKTAMTGTREGLELCLKTVIPSLFPFFLLSNQMTRSLMGSRLSILRPLASLCGIPEGGEFLLITGFLGGYPVGAQSVANVFREGQLSKEEAERMLGFCNNAGPAFLFGMAAALFPQKRMAWLLWLIHMLSAVFTSMLLPTGEHQNRIVSRESTPSLSEAMHTGVQTMAYVCGWVIIFRVVIAFLARWVLWLLPLSAQVGIMGLLELTNGCCALAVINSIPLRFVLCAGMLAAGGLCVTMQTVSVTNGLSLNYYFLGKTMQVFFSLILSCAWTEGIFLPVLTAMLLFVGILRKSKKSYSIQPIGGV